MSHNKIKVASQSPNTDGEITVGVANLDDVNITSIANDQVLQYNSTSSKWENVDITSASTSAQYIFIGTGESNAYSNSGATGLALDNFLYVYDTSPQNTISGATITNYSTTDWIESITLPAGHYRIMCNFRVKFSASGYFSFYAYDTTNSASVSSVAYIGENLSDLSFPSSVSSGFDLTGTSVIKLRAYIVSNVDTVANQGNIPSEYSSLYIEKVE
jgi:hypothetical protein